MKDVKTQAEQLYEEYEVTPEEMFNKLKQAYEVLDVFFIEGVLEEGAFDSKPVTKAQQKAFKLMQELQDDFWF